MRKNLLDLIEKTIVYKYDLPNNEAGILSTIFSTENDKCYSIKDKDDLSDLIYNSIIEYSFNEFEMEGKDYDSLHSVALKTKLRYDFSAAQETKEKYGFFGEVVLYSILVAMFKTKPLIARGYFYNPLEKSETKGYDSYHLLDNNGKIELWFGEVKFHISHTGAIKSVLSNIEKALSDSYLEDNIIALCNHKNNLNISGSKIEEILKNWEDNPEINIPVELNKYKMKLVYPVLLAYEEDGSGYDNNIKKIPEYIKENYSNKKFSLTIDYSIFFILIPMSSVKEIKNNVIQWIESKKQLMS